MQTEKLMLRKFRVLILPALAALAWNVTPAYSTIITQYTDLASFNAATSGDTTVSLAGLAGNNYPTFQGLSAANGLSDPNVTFIGIAGGGYALGVLDTSGYGWTGTGDALDQTEYPTSTYYIQVKFSAPVTAFATNLFTSSPNAVSFSVTLYGASSTQLAAPFTAATNPQPTPAFWGVTSNTPISYADFALQGPSSVGTNAFLDNFMYGTAQDQTETPEAATMLLIGSGLLGLAILGKKMRPVQPV